MWKLWFANGRRVYLIVHQNLEHHHAKHHRDLASVTARTATPSTQMKTPHNPTTQHPTMKQKCKKKPAGILLQGTRFFKDALAPCPILLHLGHQPELNSQFSLPGDNFCSDPDGEVKALNVYTSLAFGIVSRSTPEGGGCRCLRRSASRVQGMPSIRTRSADVYGGVGFILIYIYFEEIE